MLDKLDRSDRIGLAVGIVFALFVAWLVFSGWAAWFLLVATIALVATFGGMRFYGGHVRCFKDDLATVETVFLSKAEGVVTTLENDAVLAWKRVQETFNPTPKTDLAATPQATQQPPPAGAPNG